MFRIPNNKFSSEQAVHRFQLKLPRKEINFRNKAVDCLMKNLRRRGTISGKTMKKVLPSILYSIRMEMRYHSDLTGERLNDNLVKLSER